MKTTALFLFAFAMACMAQAADQGSNRQGTPQNTRRAAKAAAGGNSDAQFLTKAAQGNMAEVALGKLAADKSQNDDVKKFAQKMVEDHTNAEQDLEGIASKNNLKLPQDVNAKQKQEQTRLSKLSGAQFDRAYMRLMVADHTQDEREMQLESHRVAANGDLKDYATRTYPIISDHLTLAKTVATVLNSKARKQ